MRHDNAIDGTLSLATRLRMQFQGFKIRLLVVLCGGFMAMVLYVCFSPPHSIEIPELGSTAKWGLIDFIKWHYVRYGGRHVKLPEVVRTVARLPEHNRQHGVALLSRAQERYARQYRKYGYAFLLGGILFYIIATIGDKREKRARTEDRYVRGSRIVPVRELNRLTQENTARLELAGVFIPEFHELTPWSFVGRPRIGKTVAIKSLLDQVLPIGKRVIFDSKGDTITTHFREGDLVFAPAVDQRSLQWTIFNDITSISQIASIAAALIPEGIGNNKMWAVGAREVLEGLLLHGYYKNKKTNRELWELCCLDPEQMHAVLNETPGAERAAGMLANPKSNTAYSFYVSLIAFLKPIQLLAKMDGPFCVKQWLNSPGTNSIFIVSTPEHQDALKPVMSLFLSMLINAHLSMPDDLERRIWYFMDELTILPKIEKLVDAINFGPSKGLISILGFQSLTLLDKIYGQEIRESIWSAIGTHVLYSVGNKNTALEMCSIIGEQEVLEHRNTMSIGITDSRDGTSSMEQLTRRTLVMPDEIRDLPPLSAFIKILGYPATRVKFTYKKYESVARELVPDPSFNIDQYIQELVELRKNVSTAPGGADGLEARIVTQEEENMIAADGYPDAW